LCVQPDDSDDLSDSDSQGDGWDYGGVDVDMVPVSEHGAPGQEDEMDVDDDVPRPGVSLAHLGANS
jgi:hypothetical protein